LEFYYEEFSEFCKDESIVKQHTIRYTPQQNGVAEIMNMTLLERAKCMLSNSGLNRNFWVEVVNTTCYLVNCSPSTTIHFKIPIEVWSDKLVDYSMLRVFGCPTYYHVNEGKLEPRAKKGDFVGYVNGVKEFKIWSSSERKVILCRDVTFDELFVLHSKSVEDSNKEKDVTKQQVEFESSTIRNFSDQEHTEASDDIEQNHQTQPQQYHSKPVEESNQTNQNLQKQPNCLRLEHPGSLKGKLKHLKDMILMISYPMPFR